jgi:hypothetical protein
MRDDDDDATTTTTRARRARVALLMLAGGALAAVAANARVDTARAWYDGGRVTAMLGGADAREADVRAARATLGMPPRYPNSAAARARRERRKKTRKMTRKARAEADAPTMDARAFDVAPEMVRKTAETLRAYEGYGMDATGELVGDAWRRAWRRAQDATMREDATRTGRAWNDARARTTAALGTTHHARHHGHHGHGKKTATTRDASDATAAAGTKSDALETPVYIMSLGDKEVRNPDPTIGRTDSDRAERLLKALVREYGTAAVKRYVRLTPGVDVTDWPHEEGTMHFALKSIMKNKPSGTQLSALPWLSFYTSRDKMGHFSDKFAKERNLYTHIGCLFGHLFQWQLAADTEDKHAFMLESDAFDPTIVGMPFKDMQTLVHNAPKDYDVIFFDQPREMTFDAPAHTFKDADGDEIYLFRLNTKNTQSGLSASLVSKSFYPKLFKHLSHFGGDVVDSMLKSQLCADAMVNAAGKFTGFGAGNKPWLTCYWALPAKKGEEKHGKFIYNNY